MQKDDPSTPSLTPTVRGFSRPKGPPARPLPPLPVAPATAPAPAAARAPPALARQPCPPPRAPTGHKGRLVLASTVPGTPAPPVGVGKREEGQEIWGSLFPASGSAESWERLTARGSGPLEHLPRLCKPGKKAIKNSLASAYMAYYFFFSHCK